MNTQLIPGLVCKQVILQKLTCKIAIWTIKHIFFPTEEINILNMKNSDSYPSHTPPQFIKTKTHRTAEGCQYYYDTPLSSERYVWELKEKDKMAEYAGRGWRRKRGRIEREWSARVNSLLKLILTYKGWGQELPSLLTRRYISEPTDFKNISRTFHFRRTVGGQLEESNPGTELEKSCLESWRDSDPSMTRWHAKQFRKTQRKQWSLWNKIA